MIKTSDGDTTLDENSKGKGKAIPLQASTDPEGSRSLRLSDLKISST
jgi:hypothetical protein